MTSERPTSEPRDRAEADRARHHLRAAIRDAVPEPTAGALAHASTQVIARPIAYPFGSGQGDEIALRAGLKPMFRELLPVGLLAASRERFEQAGFVVEIAPRVYGDTRDGWDDTASHVDASHRDARQAMFVGRDPATLREAVALDLLKTDDADRELGRLLGYPRCCTEAFVGTSRHRKAPELHRRALEHTSGPPMPRLNTLDLAVFHYVPWYPCSFGCALSVSYADRLASVIGERAPAFVRAIDEALAMHRLLLTDELQVSLSGHWDGVTLAVTGVVPTAMHRHPRALLDPADAALVARISAWLAEGRRLVLDRARLVLDGTMIELPVMPLFVPFGESA